MTDAQRFLSVLAEQCNGFIPFDRFMREALFHPALGYYSNNIRTVGQQGDFSTLPTRSPFLAGALAQWIALASEKEPWAVIELGGGTGELAQGILEALGWWRRRRLAYHIVEISPPLLSKQKCRLARFPQVRWSTDITEALECCEGRALIFSNEFVDAFPVRVFQKQICGWRECALQWINNQLEEVWLDVVPPGNSAVEGMECLPEGARIEVAETYCEWLVEWEPLWKEGQFLTIDYGDLFPEVYYRRPRGTVRAFFHHELLQGKEVYERFGHQDVTADVNFSDLISWGVALGWEVTSFDSLMDWLVRWSKGHKTPTSFLDPYGIGGSFKVLCQACGGDALAKSNSKERLHERVSSR